jgi:hypothetical protein
MSFFLTQLHFLLVVITAVNLAGDGEGLPFDLSQPPATQARQPVGDGAMAEGAQDRVTDDMNSEELDRIMKDSLALTDRQIEEMTLKLKADPKDLKTRLLLIFHAATSHNGVLSGTDISLLLGLIENHPRSSLSSEVPRIYLIGAQRFRIYDEVSKKWLKIIEVHKNDAAILGNAGIFLTGDIFSTTYRDQGDALLKKARSLEPTRPRWAIGLGTLYEMDGLRAGLGPARTAYARNALKEYEAA